MNCRNTLRRAAALFALLFMAGASAAAETPETFKDCETCPEMVIVPGGSVMIGSHEDEALRKRGERPKQSLTIAEPFAMAKTEVTLRQFRTFMEESGHTQTIPERDGQPLIGCNYYDGKGYGYVAAHSWQNPGYPQRDDEPVVCVSWSDAAAFAAWLSEKTGRQYRVPSTTEFEYALRAGTKTPWPWGTDPDKACSYANIADLTFADRYPKRQVFACDDGYLHTARVGRFEPNGFGLHDMLGNAWEWSNDCWHTDLAASPLDGSSWEADAGGECIYRVPKGGSWISGPSWSRAAVRSRDGAHYRSFMLGFRVAAEAAK